jgi:hypothetical protein
LGIAYGAGVGKESSKNSKASDIMVKETGVEASMTEDDMKDYIQVVMNELQNKR